MLSVKCNSKAGRKAVLRAILLFLNISFVYASDRQLLDDLVFVPIPLSATPETDAGIRIMDKPYTNILNQNPSRDMETQTSLLSHGMASITDYENRILDIENEAGPFATELTEVLHSLGSRYLAQRRYADALASFEREEYIYRVNFGLFSEQQVPSVKAQIDALISGKMIREADDKQRYLIYLLEKCYGSNDIRLIPELVNYAEWNMSRFNEVIRFEFSDMAELSFGQATMGTREEFRLKAYDNLKLAIEHYARAVSLMVDNRQFADPELYRVERRLVESALFQASQRHMLRDPDRFLSDLNLEDEMYEKGDYSRMVRDAFKFGVNSYERQLAYLVSGQGSMARYIETMLAFGDWYMLFGKQGMAFGKYREANALLADLNIPEENINQTLNPAVPVVVPTFTATPQSPASLEQRGGIQNPYKGYVDVRFRINRNGSARHMEVLDSSANTPRDVERRLLKILADAQFRPRLDKQLLAQNEEIALRYYYAY